MAEHDHLDVNLKPEPNRLSNIYLDPHEPLKRKSFEVSSFSTKSNQVASYQALKEKVIELEIDNLGMSQSGKKNNEKNLVIITNNFNIQSGSNLQYSASKSNRGSKNQTKTQNGFSKSKKTINRDTSQRGLKSEHSSATIISNRQRAMKRKNSKDLEHIYRDS